MRRFVADIGCPGAAFRDALDSYKPLVQAALSQQPGRASNPQIPALIRYDSIPDILGNAGPHSQDRNPIVLIAAQARATAEP